MALESSGGSGTTTAGGSSSAGTSDVAGLTVQGTAPSDAEFVQEGSGTTTLSNASLNTVRQSAGTLQVKGTVTLFQQVGTITRPGTVLLTLKDSFSDSTIDPIWNQNARGDTLSEASNLLTIGFATGADARFTFTDIRNHPEVITRTPYNVFSTVAALDSVTFTTPAAGDIYTGLYILIGAASASLELVHVGIAIERRSSGGTNLVTFEVNSDDSNDLVAYSNRTVLASISDVWLRIDHLDTADRADPRAYYRTSAPTRDDNTYTLLGSLTHTSAGVNYLGLGDQQISLGAWETQNSDGVVTANFKSFEILPNLGP